MGVNCSFENICDAIWENPSDVVLGRFQEIRKIGRMSFFFVKIRFSLNYYSITRVGDVDPGGPLSSL